MLNDLMFLLSLSTLSVFNIFLPLCSHSFVFTYLWSVSYSASVSVFFSLSLPFSFSGDADENQACFIFSSEGAEYFSFAFFLFMCSLFFPGPFDVSVDSLSFRLDELTDTDARALA